MLGTTLQMCDCASGAVGSAKRMGWCGGMLTGCLRPERASAMPSFCFCASLTLVTCAGRGSAVHWAYAFPSVSCS